MASVELKNSISFKMGPIRSKTRKSNGHKRINEGASTSNGVVSNVEASRLEIKEFSTKTPDQNIRCPKCLKWRFSRVYFEEREIPDDWECKMWITKDGQRGSCDSPGSTEEPEGEHEPFPEGEVVWAKLGRHADWPGMVETCQESRVSNFITKAGLKKYNVTFFGVRPSHQWVFASKMRIFEKTVPPPSARKRLKLAIEQGNEAIATPYTVRIVKYSMAYAKRTYSYDAKINNGHVENSSSDESEEDHKKGPSADGQEEMEDQDGQLELMHPRLPSSTDGKTEAFEEWQNDKDDVINDPMPVTSKNVAHADAEGFEELQNDQDDLMKEKKDDKENGDGLNDTEDILSKEYLAYKALMDKLYPPMCFYTDG